VEVSYDGTATWQPVADHDDGRLVLDHPRGAGSVSLRIHLVDARAGGPDGRRAVKPSVA
jgi:hypothetical protein